MCNDIPRVSSCTELSQLLVSLITKFQLLLQLASCVGTVKWSRSRSIKHGLAKEENRFRNRSISTLLPLSWDKQVVKQTLLCLLGGRAANNKSMEANRKLEKMSILAAFRSGSFSTRASIWGAEFLKGQKMLVLKMVISLTDFNQALPIHFPDESQTR